MTQMHESFDNSALVEAWLKEPTFLEPVDESRVATIVHQTPQVRRWPPQVDLRRLTPMFNATKFIAASVILAFTGGLLLNVLPTDPTPAEPIPAVESATATASPTTTETTTEASTERPNSLITFPDELPEGVTRGTLETPAGAAHWIHIGDPERFPLTWATDVLPWGDGIAAYQGLYTAMAASEDGVNWEPIALPDEVVMATEIAFVDGGYFAVSPQNRVWTSAGPGDSWHELDATQMAEALGNGWHKRNRRPSAPTQVDGRTVFGLRYTYDLPREQLGIRKSKTNRRMKRLSGDRYALCGNSSCKDGGEIAPWKLRFEETARGLRVFDDKTGERLGLIADASLGELYEGGESIDHRAFEIEADEVVWIDSPWPKDPGSGPANRGGQLEATVPPPDAPRSDDVRWIGNAWLARDWSSAQSDKYWLHLGGAWHLLDESFGPEAGISAAGLEDVTLLTGEDGLWVVLHPEVTE